MRNEFIELSDEEREGMLRSITEDVKEYPVIPTFKQEEAIRISLEHGNMDFIAFTWDYLGSASGRGEHVTVHEIEAWSYATLGYAIQAESIHEALAVVQEIVEQESSRHTFIYFRVEAPDIGSPRRSFVDSALEILRETEEQLARGNTLRWDLYDI